MVSHGVLEFPIAVSLAQPMISFDQGMLMSVKVLVVQDFIEFLLEMEVLSHQSFVIIVRHNELSFDFNDAGSGSFQDFPFFVVFLIDGFDAA